MWGWEAGAILTVGLLFGSFFNVCIYRVPLKKSVVSPPSSCPYCGHRIRWFENIPILSFLLQGGKCRGCQKRISVRYPLVELAAGLLFTLSYYSFGLTLSAAAATIFCSLLLIISMIDLDHRIIPDVLSLPGIVVGFLLSFVSPFVLWHESLLGICFGGGLLLSVAYFYTVLTGKDGMGGGDIKLLAMIGAFLGWKAVLPVLFIASLVGTLIGVPLMFIKKAGRSLAIPFGPFLSLGAVIWLFWGLSILYWYLSFFNLK